MRIRITQRINHKKVKKPNQKKVILLATKTGVTIGNNAKLIARRQAPH